MAIVPGSNPAAISVLPFGANGSGQMPSNHCEGVISPKSKDRQSSTWITLATMNLLSPLDGVTVIGSSASKRQCSVCLRIFTFDPIGMTWVETAS